MLVTNGVNVRIRFEGEIKLKVLRACQHKRKTGTETFVSAGSLPANAWIENWRDGYRWFTFEPLGFLEYLDHLAENPRCCDEIGVDHKDVLEARHDVYSALVAFADQAEFQVNCDD
jgi:hypothetical protein